MGGSFACSERKQIEFYRFYISLEGQMFVARVNVYMLRLVSLDKILHCANISVTVIVIIHSVCGDLGPDCCEMLLCVSVTPSVLNALHHQFAGWTMSNPGEYNRLL